LVSPVVDRWRNYLLVQGIKSKKTAFFCTIFRESCLPVSLMVTVLSIYSNHFILHNLYSAYEFREYSMLSYTGIP